MDYWIKRGLIIYDDDIKSHLLNVCGNNETTVRDLAKKIATKLGTEVRFEEAEGVDEWLLGNSRKIHQLMPGNPYCDVHPCDILNEWKK